MFLLTLNDHSKPILMVKTVQSHFTDKKRLFEVMEEIKARVNHDYERMAEEMTREIRKYYKEIPVKADPSGRKIIPCLVVGLSGGVDSSVVVYLAARAVGAEKVKAITMPARKADESVSFSALVRQRLGMNDPDVQYVISIADLVHQQIETVNRLAWKGMAINTIPESQTDMDRMRIGNLASRTRITLLYDIARKENGKILGTGNRPEFVQGYAAKYGTPISFDFGVLDDLYKTDIYALARVLELPEEIISRTPSTGYFPGQAHEEELGATCEEQDALAFLLFEKKMPPEEVIEKYGVTRAFVETMLRRFQRSRDKRMLRQPHIQLGFIHDQDL